MPKCCSKEGCRYNVFSKNYCKYHQYLKKDKPKKMTTHKTTGELAFFSALWDIRPRKCFITKKPLGDEFNLMYFFHILPKGSYPKFRLYDKNIIFVCAEYHHDWHNIAKSDLLIKDERWQLIFDMYENLKIEYYKQTP